MFKRTSNTLLNIMLVFTVFAPVAAISEPWESTQQSEVVENLHNKLIFLMKNSETLGYQGRYDEISETIDLSFNVPLIAQIILGRHWSGLDETQKSDFISIYRKLIIATYASRFDSYEGETFQIMSLEDLNRGRKLLKTQLIRPDDDPVSLDYLISQKDDRWTIISVIANGANDISIKRGEYSDVIKLRGFNALISEIQNKIDQSAN